MERAEFQALSTQILSNLSDQGAVSSALADMVNAFDEECAAKTEAQSTSEKLTKENGKLREDNMQLFLRLTVDDGNKPKDSDGTSTDITAEDLIKDNKFVLEV